MKTIDEFIKEKLNEVDITNQEKDGNDETKDLNESLKSGYWHGNDAWILSGNDKEGYTILVGGSSEEEAKKVKKLVDADKPLGEYEDYVEFVEPDEWKEQQ